MPFILLAMHEEPSFQQSNPIVSPLRAGTLMYRRMQRHILNRRPCHLFMEKLKFITSILSVLSNSRYQLFSSIFVLWFSSLMLLFFILISQSNTIEMESRLLCFSLRQNVKMIKCFLVRTMKRLYFVPLVSQYQFK